MIVKKVESSKVKNKAASVRDLIDYILAGGAKEKVFYSGGRGFLCDTDDARREEMVALASEAARSKNPVNHYILSWREGEQPSAEQIEEAIDIFLEEMGCAGHQVIYAVHQDTDNVHCHIALNRVNPETNKVVKINRGFDLEAAHRAIARIEHAQGWSSEENARYVVLENGELARRRGGSKKKPRVKQKKRDMEVRTGEKSAERIAIENAAEIINQAETWEQLHKELAERGMRYEKSGSGAKIFVRDVPVKASRVSRKATLSQLQKRLGPYEPAPEQLQVAQRKPEPISDVFGWRSYIKARNAHYSAKAAAKAELSKRHSQEFQELLQRQRAQRKDVLSGNWKGKGALLNALRSTLAAEQAAEKAALRERQRSERAALRSQFPKFPDFETWLRLKNQPHLAEQYRYRDHRPRSEEQLLDDEKRTKEQLNFVEAADEFWRQLDSARKSDIRDFTWAVNGKFVYYFRDGSEDVAFVDQGNRIVARRTDRDSVLAALQLATQKWGSVRIFGSDKFKELCAQVAAEHGFKITNPELQEQIQKERERIQKERAQAMKTEQLKQFERYAEAVNAERYRVTCIKMREDGGKLTLILDKDKKTGITRGFTREELEQRMPELLRLQGRGENIYYTPLSECKHHILIDDMDRAKLERLISDGFKPAVLLESSPGNYQAIITIPKLGTEHDRDVGNRLSLILNREYGDPNLSGAVHPHRAPGFENRKPKHRRSDGTFPKVRLLKHERRICEKSFELSKEINAELEREASKKAQRDKKQLESKKIEAPAGSGGAAYWAHYEDVMKRLRLKSGNIDKSRIDSMIALRLRITGHDQSEIESAIRQCAPAIRDGEQKRNWDDYAMRTARYAFSHAADIQAADLEKYRDQWIKLERRRKQEEQENSQSRGVDLGL